MEIEEYIKHLKKYNKAYINEQILRIIQQESDFIIDLNTTQLLSGIDGDGKSLKSYKNDTYATFKNQLNPIPNFGTPDLKLTGSFYEQRYLQFNTVKGWPVTLFSGDEKTQKLIDEYGKAILEWTEDNLENIRDHIAPKVQEIYDKIILLR